MVELAWGLDNVDENIWSGSIFRFWYGILTVFQIHQFGYTVVLIFTLVTLNRSSGFGHKKLTIRTPNLVYFNKIQHTSNYNYINPQS